MGITWIKWLYFRVRGVSSTSGQFRLCHEKTCFTGRSEWGLCVFGAVLFPRRQREAGDGVGLSRCQLWSQKTHEPHKPQLKWVSNCWVVFSLWAVSVSVRVIPHSERCGPSGTGQWANWPPPGHKLLHSTQGKNTKESLGVCSSRKNWKNWKHVEEVILELLFPVELYTLGLHNIS